MPAFRAGTVLAIARQASQGALSRPAGRVFAFRSVDRAMRPRRNDSRMRKRSAGGRATLHDGAGSRPGAGEPPARHGHSRPRGPGTGHRPLRQPRAGTVREAYPPDAGRRETLAAPPPRPPPAPAQRRRAGIPAAARAVTRRAAIWPCGHRETGTRRHRAPARWATVRQLRSARTVRPDVPAPGASRRAAYPGAPPAGLGDGADVT